MFDLRKTYNWSELLGLTESRGDNNRGQLVVWDHYQNSITMSRMTNILAHQQISDLKAGLPRLIRHQNIRPLVCLFEVLPDIQTN